MYLVRKNSNPSEREIWITAKKNDKHDICLIYKAVKERNRFKPKYILA